MLPILADAFIRASLQRPLHERRWDAPSHWHKSTRKTSKMPVDQEAQND